MSTLASRLTIRPMTAADIAPLARALGANEPSISNRFRQQWSAWQEMYVACLDGAPAGSVNADVKTELPTYLHLYALGVAPEFQRQGIGRRLVARVKEEASAQRKDGVFLNVGTDNDGARRLYERLGYAAEGDPFEIRWQSFNDDGSLGAWTTETVIRMFKRLPGA